MSVSTEVGSKINDQLDAKRSLVVYDSNVRVKSIKLNPVSNRRNSGE